MGDKDGGKNKIRYYVSLLHFLIVRVFRTIRRLLKGRFPYYGKQDCFSQRVHMDLFLLERDINFSESSNLVAIFH